MNSRLIGVALICFAVATTLRGDVALDDSYEHVIAEKGQPLGRASTGDSVILRYADGSIRLKGGKVVAVNTRAAAGGGAATVTPVAAAAGAAAPIAKSVTSAEASSAASPLEWRTEYRTALVEAKEQHRHVFLFFTGSDWCGWCKRLQREILSTPEFARFAGEKLILVELDYPRAKPQAPELKRQNAVLQRSYQIEGYPTVVVLDENGKTVGRLGYQEGGPGPFIEALKAL